MIEMLICGLMAWYHVDCIQFYIYDENNSYPWPHSNYNFLADSSKDGKTGIVHIYNNDKNFRDMCGFSILEHELQRFHQDRWDFAFCNVKS